MLTYAIRLEDDSEEVGLFDLGRLPALRHFKIQLENWDGYIVDLLASMNRLLSPLRPALRLWRSILPGPMPVSDVERICFHLSLGGPR